MRKGNRQTKLLEKDMPIRLNREDMNNYLECMSAKTKKPQDQSQLQQTLYNYSIETVVGNIEKAQKEIQAANDSRALLSKKNCRVQKMFEECKQMLDNNINICFYAIGSNYKLINQFLDEYFAEFIQIRIKGFNTTVTIYSVALKIVQTIEKFGDFEDLPDIGKVLQKRKPKITTIFNLIMKLLNRMDSYDQKLVIAFHNLDGRNFREIEHHSILSKIANHSAVRFIASFNHVYFPNFMTKKVILDYGFCFVNNNFHEPFEKEIVFNEISWLNKRERKGADSLKMVAESLTDGQREILVFLADNLLKAPKGTIEYYNFFQLCLDEMLLSDESQLKENLSEAIDHKIVIIKTTDQGRKIMSMPFANDVMRKFANQSNM